MLDYAALRRRMVDNQIRPSEVTDHELIQAFMEVPREMFVDPAEASFAYAERAVPMSRSAPDRHMLQPVQLARLLQALPRGAQATAMIVACGTGYSAAILSRLVGSVIAVEEDAVLRATAAKLLNDLGVVNVIMVGGRHPEGHPARAPYQGILLEGAVEFVPEALIAQLASSGALATIERADRVSRAVLYERLGERSTKRALFEAWATLLPGFERKREFVF